MGCQGRVRQCRSRLDGRSLRSYFFWSRRIFPAVRKGHAAVEDLVRYLNLMVQDRLDQALESSVCPHERGEVLLRQVAYYLELEFVR